jgi:hypothetical protein
MLSIILTASALFPEIGNETIIAILVAGILTALVTLAASGGVAMRILKSLFGLVLSALGATIQVAAEIALIRIVDLAISVV